MARKRRSFAQNSAILAVDIAAFRPVADFANDANTLAGLLKALPRQDGVEEILLPGERAGRTEVARRKSGISIAEKLWQELAAVAKAAGIKMPALVASA